MDDGVLQKYASRIEPEGQDSSVLALDVTDDLGCFGWLRGTRDRCVMLEFRKKSGNCLAVACSWIERIEFDRSEGITIIAGSMAICIKGRNLNTEVRPTVRLFDGLLRHRISWIKEVSEAEAMEAAESACVVEKLEW